MIATIELAQLYTARQWFGLHQDKLTVAQRHIFQNAIYALESLDLTDEQKLNQYKIQQSVMDALEAK